MADKIGHTIECKSDIVKLTLMEATILESYREPLGGVKR